MLPSVLGIFSILRGDKEVEAIHRATFRVLPFTEAQERERDAIMGEARQELATRAWRGTHAAV
jgi:hypothetical protein